MKPKRGGTRWGAHASEVFRGRGAAASRMLWPPDCLGRLEHGVLADKHDILEGIMMEGCGAGGPYAREQRSSARRAAAPPLATPPPAASPPMHWARALASNLARRRLERCHVRAVQEDLRAGALHGGRGGGGGGARRLPAGPDHRFQLLSLHWQARAAIDRVCRFLGAVPWACAARSCPGRSSRLSQAPSWRWRDSGRRGRGRVRSRNLLCGQKPAPGWTW